MSIVDKINLAINSKNDCKQALIEKGVDMDGVPFADYGEKIRSIRKAEPDDLIVDSEFNVDDTANTLYFNVFSQIPKKLFGYLMQNTVPYDDDTNKIWLTNLMQFAKGTDVKVVWVKSYRPKSNPFAPLEHEIYVGDFNFHQKTLIYENGTWLASSYDLGGNWVLGRLHDDFDFWRNYISIYDVFSELAPAEPEIEEPTEEETYLIQAIDYDGFVIKSELLHEGDLFTLPPPPNRNSRLVFDRWVGFEDYELDNGAIVVEDSDLTVGAVYYTTSGKNEIDLEIPYGNYTIQIEASDEIDWGDGTVDTEETTTLRTHIYANAGVYTLKFSTNTLSDFKTSNNKLMIGLYLSQNAYRYEFINVFSLKYVSLNYNIYLWKLSSAYVLKCIIAKATYTNLVNHFSLESAVIFMENVRDVDKNIRTSMFSDSYNLKNVNISKLAKYIYSNAFVRCYKLSRITIPMQITSIYSNAFDGCSCLKNITLSNNVTVIYTSAFRSCYSLTNINLGNSLRSIGDNAFKNCYSLKNITFPASLEDLGRYSFSYCYSLENIDIPNPNMPKDIPAYIFERCSSLKKIVINGDINTVNSYAFKECDNLQYLIFKRNVSLFDSNCLLGSSPKIIDLSHCTSIPSVQTSSLPKNATTKILVPDELYDNWIVATNWTTYANYIYKASEVTYDTN